MPVVVSISSSSLSLALKPSHTHYPHFLLGTLHLPAHSPLQVHSSVVVPDRVSDPTGREPDRWPQYLRTTSSLSRNS